MIKKSRSRSRSISRKPKSRDRESKTAAETATICSRFLQKLFRGFAVAVLFCNIVKPRTAIKTANRDKNRGKSLKTPTIHSTLTLRLSFKIRKPLQHLHPSVGSVLAHSLKIIRLIKFIFSQKFTVCKKLELVS